MLPSSIRFSSEAQQNSNALKAQIIQAIKTEGPISFAKFMTMALLTPKLGYYCGPLHKIGTEGDFITAPELGPFFAKCIASQCQQVIQHFQHSTILEIGAGTGQLAYDCLIQLSKLNQLPSQYFILEPSENLIKRQQEKLRPLQKEFTTQIRWVNEMPSSQFKGVILANEVLDVLPVHRFEWHPSQHFELRVTLDNQENFIWHKVPAPPVLDKAITALQLTKNNILPGYQSEICLESEAWIARLSACLEAGVALFFDYGFPQSTYYHPERDKGTLMCHVQHIAHDNPFLYPGLQDLTASVDFTAIAKQGLQSGFTLSGYCHLAGFLINCGLLDFITTTNAKETSLTTQQILHLLLSPTEMGEMFKVLALGKNISIPLLGYREFDRRASLFTTLNNVIDAKETATALNVF